MTDSATASVLRGRILDGEHEITRGAIAVQDGRIAWIGPAEDLPAPYQGAGSPAQWPDHAIIAPGLVDLHCHGGGGAEFGAVREGCPVDPRQDPIGAVEETARHGARVHMLAGTTRLVGSLVSNTYESLENGVRALARLVADGTLAGIHLEGPFLSLARCGAQNPAVLRDADPALIERLTAAAAEEGAPGAIVHMTYAPERDPDGALIQALAAAGITPSMGHTDATAEQAWTAMEASLDACRDSGLRAHRPLVTHLFNGMPPMHHRSPGPVSAALAAGARGDAIVEIICDGKHLAPETIAMVLSVTGAQNTTLVSDAMSACGMSEGTYLLGGQEVRVADGEARLVTTDSLAGSVATAADCLRFTVCGAGIPLQQALVAATATPTTVLDGPGGEGLLHVGAPADLIALDEDCTVRAVMRNGDLLPRP